MKLYLLSLLIEATARPCPGNHGAQLQCPPRGPAGPGGSLRRPRLRAIPCPTRGARGQRCRRHGRCPAAGAHGPACHGRGRIKRILGRAVRCGRGGWAHTIVRGLHDASQLALPRGLPRGSFRAAGCGKFHLPWRKEVMRALIMSCFGSGRGALLKTSLVSAQL